MNNCGPQDPDDHDTPWDGHPREECGVFGIQSWEPDFPAARLTFHGLYALQHRGQEAAGIVTTDARTGLVHEHKAMGLVSRCFDENQLDALAGSVAVGHVRYATHGASEAANTQPFRARFARGELALSHNGNLTNATELTSELESRGSIFRSGLDTEIFAHLISRSRQTSFLSAMEEALKCVQGAYSMTMLFNGTLYAVRDPHGFRPLVIGRLPTAWVVASETCALDLIGAEYVRDVNPGEMVWIKGRELASQQIVAPARPAKCVFELVYFSRPDSQVFGVPAFDARVKMGQELAREAPAEADVVIPVPDSGVAAAMGYARTSGIPYQIGLTRNHYIGRTFITPGQDLREIKLKMKLNPIKSTLVGQRIVLIDDSIVRGSTARTLVRLLRSAGTREIHLRISSPPIRHPCFMGIDTPDWRELIAANHTVDEIRDFLEVDSLQYLSLDGLARAVGSSGGFCRACFDGDYPVPVKSRPTEDGAERARGPVSPQLARSSAGGAGRPGATQATFRANIGPAAGLALGSASSWNRFEVRR